MSIAADIKQARAEFDSHIAVHGCRPATAALADNQVPCPERLDLWQAYVGSPHSAAGRWFQEPDDDRRQREHFERNLRPAAA